MVDVTCFRPFSLTNQFEERDQLYQLFSSKTNIRAPLFESRLTLIHDQKLRFFSCLLKMFSKASFKLMVEKTLSQN